MSLPWLHKQLQRSTTSASRRSFEVLYSMQRIVRRPGTDCITISTTMLKGGIITTYTTMGGIITENIIASTTSS